MNSSSTNPKKLQSNAKGKNFQLSAMRSGKKKPLPRKREGFAAAESERTQLPRDLREEILVRVPATTLVRLTLVSKEWKSSVESSSYFQERFFANSQARGPNLLLEVMKDWDCPTLEIFELASGSSIEIASTPWDQTTCSLTNTTCDGLLMLYDSSSSVLFNPSTRWYRTLPPSFYQIENPSCMPNSLSFMPAFGKDIVDGILKAVWLYNTSVGATGEVFDFKSNMWRSLESTPPKITHIEPVYVDGSVYWVLDTTEKHVLSLDLHTEEFHLLSEAPPFADEKDQVILCSLKNELCASVKNGYMNTIWLFAKEESEWVKLLKMDLQQDPLHSPFLPASDFTIMPLLLVNEVLFYHESHFETRQMLRSYDSRNNSFSTVYLNTFEVNRALAYIPSIYSLDR